MNQDHGTFCYIMLAVSVLCTIAILVDSLVSKRKKKTASNTSNIEAPEAGNLESELRALARDIRGKSTQELVDLFKVSNDFALEDVLSDFVGAAETVLAHSMVSRLILDELMTRDEAERANARS